MATEARFILGKRKSEKTRMKLNPLCALMHGFIHDDHAQWTAKPLQQGLQPDNAVLSARNESVKMIFFIEPACNRRSLLRMSSFN
ncbi:hypothetical protein [Paraburkholderia sp.]|uniref:hypothetical protein n=1 Tax=Paraburkholderia sp. TaxID=1926495 RepID=UPI0023868193|nr:hypothetical protein [Paraburkholderia sp.]MDE1184314.1 hypothetical protein [Paraburkholderia sp.]